MIEYKNVQSTVKPKKIEIDEYSVWINEDIREITVTDENGEHVEYLFDQTQFNKNEYIELTFEQNKTLANEITDTQIALCDIFEMIGG